MLLEMMEHGYLEDFLFPDLPFWIPIAKLLVKLLYQLCVHLLLFLDLAQISSCLDTGLAPFFGLPRPFVALFVPLLAFGVPGLLVQLCMLYTIIIVLDSDT